MNMSDFKLKELSDQESRSLVPYVMIFGSPGKFDGTNKSVVFTLVNTDLDKDDVVEIVRVAASFGYNLPITVTP
jgi:hypothetical protein